MFSHLSHQYGVTVLVTHATIIQDQQCKSVLSSLIQRALYLLASMGIFTENALKCFHSPDISEMVKLQVRLKYITLFVKNKSPTQTQNINIALLGKIHLWSCLHSPNTNSSVI